MALADPSLLTAASRPAWWSRFLTWRDRLLASRRFQRRALAFPLTRGIARARTRALFDLNAGFVYTQVLTACVELDLFTKLAGGPRHRDELARILELSPAATECLLAAAASLDLVDRRGPGWFGLGPLGAALVGNPAIALMIRHHRLLYDDLRDPVGLLRAPERPTALSGYWAYAASERPAGLGQAEVADYSALMAASQAFIAEEVLDAYDIRRHRRLLDVGGGEGTFLIAAAARAPDLALELMDLPPVAARAQAAFEKAGLGARAQAHAGDFRQDPLPQGADLLSFVRVLHDHDDAPAAALLAAARVALAPGGTLLIGEPMAGTAGAEPVGHAYFGFYLMAMRSGRPRTAEELMGLVRVAGFTAPRLHPTRTPLLVRVLSAQRPVG